MSKQKLVTTLELDAEEMNFAAAHFTLFSATTRERLHGHNYRLFVAITTVIQDNGLAFDYAIYKEKLINLCQALNSYLLLPQFSPHLKIEENDANYQVTFNGEEMTFLKCDTVILPIRNVTIEELAHYFAAEIIKDEDCKRYEITKIVTRISNGPGQSAEATLVL